MAWRGPPGNIQQRGGRFRRLAARVACLTVHSRSSIPGSSRPPLSMAIDKEDQALDATAAINLARPDDPGTAGGETAKSAPLSRAMRSASCTPSPRACSTTSLSLFGRSIGLCLVTRLGWEPRLLGWAADHQGVKPGQQGRGFPVRHPAKPAPA